MYNRALQGYEKVD
ncbi:hypothetical protein S40285_10909 [Stachybotrys chlorohalonatus IBT 40285]|uniref:Uncharacterized protein n=1 Tax=Stachybotrys chlorohalonatus (strain IBT 40285) TaxID=1283841 RepID=A0A084QX85_STAC4|nr:hypothetical protein S40285_10909 [Stachybotrys chlorohalonata IBT 40285]